MRILSAPIGALVALLVGPAALACSCVGLSTQEKLDSARAVFRGTAIAIDAPERLDREALEAMSEEERQAAQRRLYEGAVVTFQVEQAWKGITAPQVALHVGSGMCCDCTFGARPFEEGGIYTITAYINRDGRLSASACGAVDFDTSAEAVSATLGEPAPVTGEGVQGLPPERETQEGESQEREIQERETPESEAPEREAPAPE
jgi:hypothetical protein